MTPTEALKVLPEEVSARCLQCGANGWSFRKACDSLVCIYCASEFSAVYYKGGRFAEFATPDTVY